MKRWQVENKVGDELQCAGEKPWEDISYDMIDDYIEAETPEEAIAIAIDYLADVIRDNILEGRVEVEDGEITVYNDEDVAVENYYDFTAKDADIY